MSINNKAPLYQVIKDEIKKRILNGEYKIGETIPTESQLEESFDVSKITVRRAIELLCEEGYLAKQSGKGTTVISDSVFNKPHKIESFFSILNYSGLELKGEVIEFKPVILDENDEHYKYFGRFAYRLERICYLEGKPYLFFEHYLSPRLKGNKEDLINEDSIYKTLYRSGIEAKAFRDEFYIGSLGDKVKNYLKVNGENILVKKRVTYSEENNVIEVAYVSCNSNIKKYEIKYEV